MLNGYETGKPLDKKAKELEMTIFISVSAEEICRKIEGVIAGILEISVSNDFITIEMVGRNVLVQASAVGTKLMSLAENIARQLGKKEIRLESLDSVVEWYDEHLGYVEYDQPYNGSEFGRLTPKRKLMQV